MFIPQCLGRRQILPNFVRDCEQLAKKVFFSRPSTSFATSFQDKGRRRKKRKRSFFARFMTNRLSFLLLLTFPHRKSALPPSSPHLSPPPSSPQESKALNFLCSHGRPQNSKKTLLFSYCFPSQTKLFQYRAFCYFIFNRYWHANTRNILKYLLLNYGMRCLEGMPSSVGMPPPVKALEDVDKKSCQTCADFPPPPPPQQLSSSENLSLPLLPT